MQARHTFAKSALRFLHVAILWYSVKNMKSSFGVLFIIFFLPLLGLTTGMLPYTATGFAQTGPAKEQAKCLNCHRNVSLDTSHNFPCAQCHGGQEHEERIEEAHAGLIAHPSHPAHSTAICGKCHRQQTEEAAGSLHYTLDKKITAIRTHFGAHTRLGSPMDIPENAPSSSVMALADDLLRRRCLRCHVYSSGDSYSAVTHGTGCSACHLPFQQGKLKSHAFTQPTDQQCLSCHYSNHVGGDYYGHYEHDFHWEYRTPFSSQGYPPRPFGIETHELAPDIHQQRGLSCVDCHQKSGHDQATTVRCATCHEWKPGKKPSLTRLSVREGTLLLTARLTGKEHPVPQMRHPAHQQYGKAVACQVCHAQWSFNDSTTHLLLSKNENYEPWEELTIQASSEIEAILEHNIQGNSTESSSAPSMKDGLNGQSRPGIWYQGFTQRRWEQMLIQKDSDGIIKVFRPLLDLRLSMIDSDGTVRWDNIAGKDDGLRPYTPHTTGHAGLFYRDRFAPLLTP